MHTHHFHHYIFIAASLLIGLYFVGVIRSNKKFKKWQFNRTLYWVIGILSITIAFLGPLQNHGDFIMHMYSHLLIGMISPLFLSLAQPLTLLLRNLPVAQARQITSILKSSYFRIITHPVVAMIINIGGLWFLYTSSLIYVMHEVFIVNIVVHIHLFLGGYFFTISVLSIPPLPNRASFRLRAITLILFMALHSILAKWLYANPLFEDVASVQKGAMIMYYGGDIVDVLMVISLLYDYYKPSKREIVFTKKAESLN